MSSKSRDMFRLLLKKADMIGEDYWKVSTAKRKTLIIPTGFKVYDTDLGIVFVGDGSSYGGKLLDDRDDVRILAAPAASAFTLADALRFVTIASAVATGGVFTCTAHGLVVGDKVIAMDTTATYGLTQDVVYRVATRPDANKFTLVKDSDNAAVVVTEDTTSNKNLKKLAADNDYITWAQGAALRTGDAITAAEVETLPTGITAAAFYIIKDDTAANGGADLNTTTKFRIASSRANALAGTTVKIRSVGAGANTFVTTNAYARGRDKTIMAAAAAAIEVIIPSAVVAGVGATYEITNTGAAHCTVKSVAGTVDGGTEGIAGAGVRLKAASRDFIVLKSDGANWVAFAKQITP